MPVFSNAALASCSSLVAAQPKQILPKGGGTFVLRVCLAQVRCLPKLFLWPRQLSRAKAPSKPRQNCRNLGTMKN